MKAILLLLPLLPISLIPFIHPKHRYRLPLMKNFFFAVVSIITVNCTFAQTEPAKSVIDSLNPNISTAQPIPIESSKREWSKIDLSNRSNDHFMFQYGSDTWTGTNDSVSPKGFSRFFNAYIMIDKPFKTNPKFSIGLGVGIGSSNMFFENTYVDVKSLSRTLPFKNVDTVDHFKKFKLTTIFLEAPVELRFSSNPLHSSKSFKVALGAKIGTLIKAYTKGKNLVDKNDNTVNAYVAKESSKRFFETFLKLCLWLIIAFFCAPFF